MPRYFLHADHAGQELALDEEGAIFDGVDAAAAEATRSLRELLAGAIMDTRAAVPTRIIIHDENGEEACVVLARDLVPPALR